MRVKDILRELEQVDPELEIMFDVSASDNPTVLHIVLVDRIDEIVLNKKDRYILLGSEIMKKSTPKINLN